jgi:phosphoribosylamine--glycine ligase
MKILFVSNDLIGGNIAHILKKEGCEVKLHVEEEDRRRNLTNIVKKTKDWRSELSWVGKDGVIVFDDVGYGFVQDSLRNEGYSVFGGSAKGDMLEQDRVLGQKVFKQYGLKVVTIKDFNHINQAINYVKRNPGLWVIKQNGSSSKSLNYVGILKSGKDVLDMLKTYKRNNSHGSQVITLQKKIVGVEIAVTRYFNGSDWVGPMLINIEHKKFFPGDIGPTTSEMGTIGWYEENEKNKLFRETLYKIKPYLNKINYRGIFDINCIVNETGIYPLEATSRFGSPIAHLQTELNISPWSEIIDNVSKAKEYKLKYKKGVGIVVVVAVPPFPYAKKIHEHSQIGTRIYFEESLTEEEKTHIHFEEVSWHNKYKCHYVSDDRGYVLYVTGSGKDIRAAQKMAYNILKKIHIPKMMYRNDIGESFAIENKKKLKKWGYI